MFGCTGVGSALETSLQISSNCSSKPASSAILPARAPCAADLTAPLYNVTSKSSSTFDCTSNKGSANALTTTGSGGIASDLKKQIDAHVAQYSNQLKALGDGGSTSSTGSLSSAGYGGSISTGSTTKNCPGAVGSALSQSKSLGSSHDELGRTPGQLSPPPLPLIPKLQDLGKAFSDKCCDAKDSVSKLFKAPSQPTSTVSAAGYGGVVAPVTNPTMTVSAAGYGGSVSTGTPSSVTKQCHGAVGDDRRQSQLLGHDDDHERMPAPMPSPLTKLQDLGKAFSDKCCDAKDSVSKLFKAPSLPTSTVSAAGYGGVVVPVTNPTMTVSAAGYGGTVSTGAPSTATKSCHFNQGLGNGAEGGDPGKSAPHGGSNDELGRTPGQKWVPTLVASGKP